MEAGRASDRRMAVAAFAVVLLVVVVTHRGGSVDGLPRFIHVRVTRGSGAEGSVGAEWQKPYAALLFACNHKTGTVQASCFAKSIRRVTNVRVRRVVGNATAGDVTSTLAGMGIRPPLHPAITRLTNPPAQKCFFGDPSQKGGFPCPQPEVPCNASGTPVLSLDGCFLQLPLLTKGPLGIVHFVRNPWDATTSAYWYHMQQPPPEAWLTGNFSSFLQKMEQQGVPLERVRALGVGEQQGGQSYAEVLRSLPSDRGVQLEFWRSAPDLYAMARQERAFVHHGTHMQIRFEDMMGSFNATWRLFVQQFYPEDEEAIMHEGQQCDLTTWDKNKLRGSSHVTSSKHPPEEKERLQRVLAGQIDIRWHLCLLADSLGYPPAEVCPQAAAATAAGG